MFTRLGSPKLFIKLISQESGGEGGETMGLWVNSHYFIQVGINYKDYAMKAPNVNDLNEGGLVVFILSVPPVVYPKR